MLFNLKNGKRYIGSSKNLYNRLHTHLSLLENDKSHNKYLQSSWNKYGKDNFILQVLEYCTIEDQFIREQYYLDTLQPEYNLTLNVEARSGLS